MAQACASATQAEQWEAALAACRESYWSLIGRALGDIRTEDLRAARAPAYRNLGRIAEAMRHPEQAMYFYRQGLRGGEDSEVRARLDALAPREVHSTLHRPVFPDVMFHLLSSLVTGTLLHTASGPVDVVSPQQSTSTIRYERRAESTEHDMEVGLAIEEYGDTTRIVGRLRHGETWWSLGGLGGDVASAGPYEVESMELVELLDGGLPEVRVLVADRRGTMDFSNECVFRQQDHRVLSLFGLREGVGAVRYAEIMIARSERQEAALHCLTAPEHVPPTFHWSVEPIFDPAAGTLELRPVVGMFPDEVLGAIPLNDFHCRWGTATSAWTCPHP